MTGGAAAVSRFATLEAAGGDLGLEKGVLDLGVHVVGNIVHAAS
jgi:hypothetical protein